MRLQSRWDDALGLCCADAIGHFLYGVEDSNYAILFARDATSASGLPRQERPAIQDRTAMDSQQGSDAVLRNPPEPVSDSSLRRTWRAWGDDLRRRHLDGLCVALLDASAPLALVTSQLLHFGKPLLGNAATHLAAILESESETAAFRDYLGGTRTNAATADEGDS